MWVELVLMCGTVYRLKVGEDEVLLRAELAEGVEKWFTVELLCGSTLRVHADNVRHWGIFDLEAGRRRLEYLKVMEDAARAAKRDLGLLKGEEWRG